MRPSRALTALPLLLILLLLCAYALTSVVAAEAAAAQERSAAPAAASAPAAFLDQLLARARAAGPTAYRARPAKIDGVAFPRSLVVEVSSDEGAAGKEAQRAASVAASRLSFPLDGRYERFAVTLGRDDAESERGGGLVRFEILADERSLYRSPLMRSSRTVVRVPPGITVRASAARLNLDVRGVRTLQLVTQFASDIPQQGTMVRWARGCVWGDARLYGGTGGGEASAAESSPEASLRDMLRLAALRTAAVAATAVARTPRPATKKPPSMRLAIVPLAAPSNFPGGGRRVEQITRLLREQAVEVRRGGAPVFALLDRGAESRFQRGLLRSRGRDASPEAAARDAGADVLLVPVVISLPERGHNWYLELRVISLLKKSTPPLPLVTVPFPVDFR